MPAGTDLTEARVAYSEVISPGANGVHTYNQTETVKHTHYFDINGDLAAVYLSVPYASLKQESLQTTKTNGFGDPTILFAWGMYNSPALTPREYATHDKNGLSSACSVAVTLPIGAYNSNIALNTGANRYTEKGECQLGWAHNKLLFEVIGGMTHYGDNNDYYNGNLLKQDNLYHIETHTSFNFTHQLWASLDTFYLNGGDASLNNHYLNKKQNSFSIGTVIGYVVDRHQLVKLIYQDSVNVSDTSYKLQGVALSYNYLW